MRYFVRINDDKSNDFFVVTTDDVPVDVSSISLEISTEDHDKFFSDNGKYRFIKSISNAVGGSREYTLSNNGLTGDTITALGKTIIANTDFTLGSDIATTIFNIVTLLKSKTKFTELYSVESSNSTITITELIAGGGNTPPEVTTTGSIVITNGTTILSTSSITKAVLEEAVDSSEEILAKAITSLNTAALTAIKAQEEYYTACLTSSLYSDTEMATILSQVKVDKLAIITKLQTAQEALING